MTEAKKTVVVSIRLDEATHEGLAELAKADRRKLATYLALVLEDHLAAKQEGSRRDGTKERKAR